jgi:hypothetical protein
MSAADPPPPPLAVRLRLLRFTLLDLIAELQITAERAELFAAKRKPRLSGTPQLETHRAHLARLHEAAIFELHPDRGEPAAELRAVLTAAGLPPPRPVLGEPYAVGAVLQLAQAVLLIGWDDGPGLLRGVRDPWHSRTPAERLSGAERWVWERVLLPYFGEPAVVAEFTAAVVREFDRAERAAGEREPSPWRSDGGKVIEDTRRREWPSAAGGPFAPPTVVNISGEKKHAVSEAVRVTVLGVFQPGEVLAFDEVFKRLGGDRGDWSDGHIRRALTHLAKSDDGRLRRVSTGRYTCAEKNL